MNNLELAQRAINTAKNCKTLYVKGGWGQPLTAKNKLYFKTAYSFNRQSDRKAKIDSATSDTFAFDCVCFVKSLLDGFTGDTSAKFGGATYGKPCPDTTIETLLGTCTSTSTDMSNIEVGEFMVFADKSHCGIYVGEIDGVRYAVECTYRWNDGVQLIDIDRTERKSLWKWHGKLKYVDYTATAVNTLKSLVTEKVKAKKGDKGEYIKAIQQTLIAKGYSCGTAGADGDFGSGTENGVKNFQKANGLTSDGIVGYDTINKLLN